MPALARDAAASAGGASRSTVQLSSRAMISRAATSEKGVDCVWSDLKASAASTPTISGRCESVWPT